MSLLTRRFARLAAARSPRLVANAVRREARLRRADRELGLAARRGAEILAGPFVGEVGYELLYWIPFLRRLLHERGIDRERVTVLTRGGAAAWYSDFAAHAAEIFDVIEPAEYGRVLAARRERARDAKQLEVDPFDLELAGRAADAFVLHPMQMYARFRFVWEGLVPPAGALGLGEYRTLTAPHVTVGMPLPERYVAVKAYFSDALPDGEETRRRLEELVRGLARDRDVVVLANDVPLDEHAEWDATAERVHSVASLLEPRSNLAVQTKIVAGAELLISTYGGFAYLGPMLGVPTVGVYARRNFNPVHLEVARAAFPDARLAVVPLERVAEELE